MESEGDNKAQKNILIVQRDENCIGSTILLLVRIITFREGEN